MHKFYEIPSLFEDIHPKDPNLFKVRDAAIWASHYTGRKITTSNISYLYNYGKINKYTINGSVFVNIQELKNYFDANFKSQTSNKYEQDTIWHLSFVEYTEKERTKHVHRLHPYKGKFIPQLVEYFLNDKTDNYKKEIYFNKGDIVIDPFCGSGTTLVQANELGINAIGVDISEFNCLLTNVKIGNHNINELRKVIKNITTDLVNFTKQTGIIDFDNELKKELSNFNNQYFPAPTYRQRLNKKEIDEKNYSSQKLSIINQIYSNLLNKHNIKVQQENQVSFLDKWFTKSVRDEIEFLRSKILSISEKSIKDILLIILSRTVRSCRATTHADLGTLKEPVYDLYYCKKHSKICKPIFSLLEWWEYYTEDTIKRLYEFNQIRTNTYQFCIKGDSRELDLIAELEKFNPEFSKLLKSKKSDGIFTSPPYVGLIDYHEQHAYAYELFGFERNDDLEIGSQSRGQSLKAREKYVEDISRVLINMKKFLKTGYNVFIVANDKYNLYPSIAQKSGMKIINSYKRPVLNRVEKDRETPYSEIIFHLKESNQ